MFPVFCVDKFGLLSCSISSRVSINLEITHINVTDKIGIKSPKIVDSNKYLYDTILGHAVLWSE